MLWKDASRPRGDDHMTKSHNRKLIRVISSNERRKHKRVDLRDYNMYLNQIWYRAQIPHYQQFNTTEWPDSNNRKIQDGGGRHLEFRKKSITPDWIKICALNFIERCITAMRR